MFAESASAATSVVVRLESSMFLTLLSRAKGVLVVMCEAGIFRTKYQYLTSYKGLMFFTESEERLDLPRHVETLRAESISAPKS
jgi:hypothetical protein